MKTDLKIKNPISKRIANIIINFPIPTSISYIWNWGSLLAIIIAIQIISGIILSIHYTPHIDTAFSSVIHIIRDVNRGWILRFIHLNGASLIFMLIFIHISRGILFSSHKLSRMWISGIIILFLIIATAFLGYVLPWGQISFWGASVITNLVSAIPYLGKIIVEWLWGGFSIRNATLNRFFTLHFLLPIALILIALIHLISLHSTGSNNPLGYIRLDKLPFHPYFSRKDSLGIIKLILISFLIRILLPFYLCDPENFNPANPLNSPIHIQPEWYFLFAYAILRSIPNKLGGVIGLIAAILIISILPLKKKIHSILQIQSNPKNFYVVHNYNLYYSYMNWS